MARVAAAAGWIDPASERGWWIYSSGAHTISFYDSITCPAHNNSARFSPPLPPSLPPCDLFLSPFPSVRMENVKRQNNSADANMPPSSTNILSHLCASCSSVFLFFVFFKLVLTSHSFLEPPFRSSLSHPLCHTVSFLLSLSIPRCPTK